MLKRLLLAAVGFSIILGAAGMSQVSRKARRQLGPQAASETAADPGPAGVDEPKQTQKTQSDSDQNSEKPSSKKPRRLEQATFGGGCFWCMEAVFERIPGVRSVVSGYAGGHVPNPSYEMVCTGLTGHAEVIQIEFDPSVLPFDKLLKYFWTAHDPTTLNSQGPDFGTQYRSVILYHSEEQKEEARKQYKELMAKRGRKSPIVTELVPFTVFYPADAYHQDYYRNHPDADYSQTYIEPKVRKVNQKLRAEAAKEAKSERPQPTPNPRSRNQDDDVSKGSAR